MNVFIRIALVGIWVLIMLSFIWNHDINGALYSVHFNFDINTHPNFMDLFIVNDIYLSKVWWFFKGCHFVGFGIFDGLLYLLFRKKNLVLGISIAFAIFTEVLQLYFYRDGRIYDMVIDSLGALLMYGLLTVYSKGKGEDPQN